MVKELTNQKITPIVIGEGAKIISQYPSRGTTVMSGDKVILLTNDANKKMIDLTGWSSGDAIHLFTLLGIAYETEGHGYITNQSIKPGTVITGKETIKIILNDKYVEEQDSKKET